MGTITHVLTNVEYNEQDRQRLISIFAPAEVHFVKDTEKDLITELVQKCEVAYLKGNVQQAYYQNSKLQWIHSNIAGLEGSLKKEFLEQGIRLTGSAGRSAEALAEHAFFFMLNHVYSIKRVIQAQKDHNWGFDQEMKTSLYGKTLGIVGFGNTGKAVYEKAKAFGMDVVAYNRSPIDSCFSLKKRFSAQDKTGLQYLLQESDYIVLALSLTDETYHIIDKSAFALMKSDAFLVNIGRGSLIDEPALIEALKNNLLGGAGLDVTEKEPLAGNSPLWDWENVLITPHSTPRL
jgi:phosphoglycerate dehydrogenase-like enzyme